MSDLDIVARLQLNAQQFSSETGQRFAEMKTRAASAASDIKASFGTSFAEVNKLAQQALTLPRTGGGSLDLSGEIASLKNAAAGADQNAQSLRELRTAQLAAAVAGTADAQALKLDADAAMAAIAVQEKLADDARARISTLQAVQAELAKTTSMTEASAAANDNETGSTNRNFAAKQELFHVFRSVGDSIAAGIPIQQVFAMEIGRVAEAYQLYTASGERAAAATKVVAEGAAEAAPALEAAGAAAGEAGAGAEALEGGALAAGGALSGFLIPAVVAGIAIFAPFVTKLLDGNDALGKAVDQLKADAEQTAITEQAKDAFGKSVEGVAAAIRDQGHALDQTRAAEIGATQQAFLDAQANQAREVAIRRVTAARLEQALADQRATASVGGQMLAGDAGGVANNIANAQVTDLKKQLDEANASLAAAEAHVGETQAAAVAETAKRMADPMAQITKFYEDQRRAIVAHAAASHDWATEQQQLLKVDQDEAAAKKAHEESERGGHGGRLGYEGEGDDLAIANAQAKVAEATNDVEKAEANLELVRAEAKKELDQHSISLATYTSRVNGAAAAVKAAKQEEADRKAVVAWGAKNADPDLFVEAKKAPSMGNDGFDEDFRQEQAARKQQEDEAEQSMHHLADLYQDLFSGNTRNIWQDFQRQGAEAMSAILAQQTKHFFDDLPPGVQKFISGTVGPGMAYGELGGSVFASITGGKQDPLASGIGGALGDVAGKALGKTLAASGSKLLGSLGGAAGPIGAVVGGVLGNVLGGLFSSPKWANAQIGLNAYGTATGGTGSGNGSSAVQAATGESSSVAAAVNQIAQQLGATISSLPAMTLGSFNGNYRVATTSTSASLNYNNFSSDVLKDFGGDQQAAIEYAARYSISHAVITGISDASKKILADGSEDLQSALTKAMEIEAVPKDLKAMLDPVGAAIDALNLKWQQTVDALKEGGATAEQMAQAQQLYNLQLDQAKNSTDAADQALKDFLTSLKVGTDSPYSLRDQETAAKAALQPFLDQIGAGQSIDQSKFQDAAKSYLDVERNLYGSTQGYFDAQDLVQSAVNQAISTIDNATPVTASVADPFAQATATSTASTADNTATGNDLLSQVSGTLSNVQDLLATIAANTAGGGSDFIGSGRNFVLAA